SSSQPCQNKGLGNKYGHPSKLVEWGFSSCFVAGPFGRRRGLPQQEKDKSITFASLFTQQYQNGSFGAGVQKTWVSHRGSRPVSLYGTHNFSNSIGVHYPAYSLSGLNKIVGIGFGLPPSRMGASHQ
ncbi:hypothetical protein KI387_029063, partial [Taxus chinensis]